jgi:hypothetical protein
MELLPTPLPESSKDLAGGDTNSGEGGGRGEGWGMRSGDRGISAVGGVEGGGGGGGGEARKVGSGDGGVKLAEGGGAGGQDVGVGGDTSCTGIQELPSAQEEDERASARSRVRERRKAKCSISTTNMPTLVDAAKEVDALVYEAVVNASVEGGMDRGGKGESSEHQDTIDHILRGLNIDSEVAQHNGLHTHTFIEGLQVDPCQRSRDGDGGAGAGEGDGVGGGGRSLIFEKGESVDEEEAEFVAVGEFVGEEGEFVPGVLVVESGGEDVGAGGGAEHRTPLRQKNLKSPLNCDFM